MKTCYLLLALVVFSASAQQRKHFTINASTPEGELLQNIGQESDDAKKLALMQDFVSKYPKHEGAGWVYDQMQQAFLKQKDYDKALDAGEKALAADPEDLDAAYNNLKAGEGKTDPDLVKKWSAATSAIARKIAAGPATSDDEKQSVDHAKQVDTYTEYSLYATALQITDPAKVADLVDSLMERNPKSQYVPMLSGKYLTALQQSGKTDKASAMAEKIVAVDPSNADALLIAADSNLQKNRTDKAIAYATKVTEVLASKPAPEGVSAADWEKTRQAMLGRARWIAGVGYGAENKFGPADKALRAALPAVSGNSQLTATALFYLGLSNYQLGKTLGDKARTREGLKFFEQCSAIKSTLQDQALKNVRAIRGELGIR
jgi:tetratricopeptide (TPR) repeat protein